MFADATKSFLESVARTVRMIRSKGVGVFFVTQAPTDVPSEVLGQLGARVQHALRAFTPEDADALKKTVRTYPKSDFYDLEKLLTEVGIGEAAVTILSERGVPTPVVHTRLRAPRSSMTASSGVADGGQGVDAVGEIRHAAREGERGGAAGEARRGGARAGAGGRSAGRAGDEAPRKAAEAKEPSDPLTEFLGSSEGKTLQREVIRGAFSLLRKRL